MKFLMVAFMLSLLWVADADVNQTTCIECSEVEALNLSCKDSILQVPCSSQCFTAKGNITYFYKRDQVITTAIEERGCANCTDKEAICAAFNSSLGNMTLLDCDVECCSGNNCNMQNLTAVIPATPTTIPTQFPTAPVNQTTCIACSEIGPSNLTCNQSFFLVPCSYHCAVLRGKIEFYTNDEVTIVPIGTRGCINCTDKEAFCPALNSSLASANASLLACEIECCFGNNCNNLNFPGLEKNEIVPIPVIPLPSVPSTEQKEESVQISISVTTNQYEWNFQTDKTFKEKTSSVTTSFCSQSRVKCALKEARRKRRAPFDLYTADQVHLLPGYPRNASGSLQVAFYVQQPRGLFIGNASILPGETLVNIVKTYKSEMETAIGANISQVEAFIQSLLTPTTTSPTTLPTTLPTKVQDSNDTTKWIAIGVGIGVFVLICFILLVTLWLKKKKNSNIVVLPDKSLSMESLKRTSMGFDNATHT